MTDADTPLSDRLAISERPFEIGQSIGYRPAMRGFRAATGPYRVIGYRPAEAGERLYRIKSDDERHERIARESELWNLAQRQARSLPCPTSR